MITGSKAALCCVLVWRWGPEEGDWILSDSVAGQDLWHMALGSWFSPMLPEACSVFSPCVSCWPCWRALCFSGGQDPRPTHAVLLGDPLALATLLLQLPPLLCFILRIWELSGLLCCLRVLWFRLVPLPSCVLCLEGWSPSNLLPCSPSALVSAVTQARAAQERACGRSGLLPTACTQLLTPTPSPGWGCELACGLAGSPDFLLPSSLHTVGILAWKPPTASYGLQGSMRSRCTDLQWLCMCPFFPASVPTWAFGGGQGVPVSESVPPSHASPVCPSHRPLQFPLTAQPPRDGLSQEAFRWCFWGTSVLTSLFILMPRINYPLLLFQHFFGTAFHFA